ncbi:hypothetical protein FMEXI_11831 [Fusarium mexicanum]|uniref:Uncharacterized protein n=1 Tax=Fusarium mexicanum TaxID=751941 RepID=A0A8H5IAY7_9HYPO|nr:hypothetical protein FMEXI_11831 [Fusarium mexicanum]
MAPSQDHPFDHSKADFTKIGPRRLHMEAFFRHLGLWHADEVEELCALIEPEICGRLQQKGLRQVGHAFFEYYVDKSSGTTSLATTMFRLKINRGLRQRASCLPTVTFLRVFLDSTRHGYLDAKLPLIGWQSLNALREEVAGLKEQERRI